MLTGSKQQMKIRGKTIQEKVIIEVDANDLLTELIDAYVQSLKIHKGQGKVRLTKGEWVVGENHGYPSEEKVRQATPAEISIMKSFIDLYNHFRSLKTSEAWWEDGN